MRDDERICGIIATSGPFPGRGKPIIWAEPLPWPADSRSWENIHEEPQPGDSNRLADDPRVRMRWRGVRRRRRRIHDEPVLRARRASLGRLCPGKPLDDAACDRQFRQQLDTAVE